MNVIFSMTTSADLAAIFLTVQPLIESLQSADLVIRRLDQPQATLDFGAGKISNERRCT